MTLETDDDRTISRARQPRCEAGSIRYSPGGDHHVVEIGATGAHCLVLEARGFPELRLTARMYVPALEVTVAVKSLMDALLVAPRTSPATAEERSLALFSHVRDRSRTSRVRHHTWIVQARDRINTLDLSRAPLADAAR